MQAAIQLVIVYII